MRRAARRVVERLPAPLQLGVARARGALGWLRVQRPVTRVLGPRHRRSRRRVELDITWACNLRCYNCNRSCTQAPTGERMTVEQVRRFVDESVRAGVRWERVRVIGGEPTVHPDFLEIVDVLRAWRRAHAPEARIEVATNGHGRRVRRVLDALPDDVEIEDTAKDDVVQPFDAFNVAPVDQRAYRAADFTNGCGVTSHCGIGLTPHGWYPCAVAGGIDRVMGLDLGRPHLPRDEDEMLDQLDAFCRRCGHFERRERATADRPLQSATWRRAYAAWRERRPVLGRYG